MHKLNLLRSVAVLLAFCSLASYGRDTLSTAQASRHVGETATVCGVVAGTKYAERVKGAPTFINLDAPYPNQVFTALIWGESRHKFSLPPELTRGRICVTGQISIYRAIPQIIVAEPSQLSQGN